LRVKFWVSPSLSPSTSLFPFLSLANYLALLEVVEALLALVPPLVGPVVQRESNPVEKLVVGTLPLYL
jgi:hypothetical protein